MIKVSLERSNKEHVRGSWVSAELRDNKLREKSEQEPANLLVMQCSVEAEWEERLEVMKALQIVSGHFHN